MRLKNILPALCMALSLPVGAQEYMEYGMYSDNTAAYIPVSDIDSITYGDHPELEDNVVGVLARNPKASIFYAALVETGMADSLRTNLFDYGFKHTVAPGWLYWHFYGTPYTERENRQNKFTVFAETDEAYKANGINSLSDLKVYAAKVYDEVYPDDAAVKDPTDRRNSLNRFVSYHLLDRYVKLSTEKVLKQFVSTVQDMACWHETLMPHSLLKCSYPTGSEEGWYVNRRGVQDRADARGVKVRGAMVSTADSAQTAFNGICYYIDEIITYGKKTQQVVLDERMRMDAMTLSPDFMNSAVAADIIEDLYGDIHSFDAYAPGTTKNIESNGNIYVTPGYLSWWDYLGNEVAIIAKSFSAVRIKLPPVPEGTYEVRLGFTNCEGRKQVAMLDADLLEYDDAGNPILGGEGNVVVIDDVFSSIISDAEVTSYNYETMLDSYVSDERLAELNAMTETNRNRALARQGLSIKWWEWFYTLSEEARVALATRRISMTDEERIADEDKLLHGRGWMKGPASYLYNDPSYGWTMRSVKQMMRRVVGQFQSDGKTDHYLTIREGTNRNYGELHFDYIELCPKSVYDNPAVPEDQY